MAYFLLILFGISFFVVAETTGTVELSNKSNAEGKSHGVKAEHEKLKRVPSLNPEMRLKLWKLSELPPDQLNVELAKWPRFQEMTPENQKVLLTKMEELRNSLHKMAEIKAREYRLQLSPEKEKEFAARYIQRRLEEEKVLWEKTKPMRMEMEATLRAEMLKEFGSGATIAPTDSLGTPSDP